MSIIIKDEKRWEYLTRRIFKAQIILDRLKETVKKGQKNIKIMREEKESLKCRKERSSVKEDQDGNN